MASVVTPVDQTIFSGEGRTGDCWRACIASLLDLPCADVPHFVAEDGHQYKAATQKWLLERGYFIEWAIIAKRDGVAVIRMRRNREIIVIEPEYLIIHGDGPRGNGHCVIADTEKWLKVGFRAEPRGDEGDDCSAWLAHDPHPSRAGLLTSYEAYAIVPA